MIMSVLMVVAVALPIMVMVVSVLMAMAFSMLMVMMVMAMVVVVSTGAFDMFVELVVEAGVVHGVEHPVPELMFFYIEDGAHEGEVDLLLGLQYTVVLDTAIDVREVECESGTVIEGYGGLDVAEEHACFLLHPFSNGHQCLGEPCLGVCIPAVEGTCQTDSASAGLLQRGGLVVMLVLMVVAVAFPIMVMVVSVLMATAFLAVVVVMVAVFAHCIIS
jgi:hypothetical protein